MTVGEVVDILNQVERDRTVYIPDITDGTAQPVAACVDLKHLHLPVGISIPDDVALLPARMLEDEEDDMSTLPNPILSCT